MQTKNRNSADNAMAYSILNALRREEENATSAITQNLY